jgi:hypothetical protein
MSSSLRNVSQIRDFLADQDRDLRGSLKRSVDCGRPLAISAHLRGQLRLVQTLTDAIDPSGEADHDTPSGLQFAASAQRGIW